MSGGTVYVVCHVQRGVCGVYETYASAYASIDAVLLEQGLVPDTDAWTDAHDRWDIVQRVVHEEQRRGA